MNKKYWNGKNLNGTFQFPSLILLFNSSHLGLEKVNVWFPTNQWKFYSDLQKQYPVQNTGTDFRMVPSHSEIAPSALVLLIKPNIPLKSFSSGLINNVTEQGSEISHHNFLNYHDNGGVGENFSLQFCDLFQRLSNISWKWPSVKLRMGKITVLPSALK